MRIVDLTPQQLRQFIQRQHEKDYLLIDVRQPGEYAQAHIPGAHLMPLPELIQSMETLPQDKTLVFYCHSGGRSMAAAAMVADETIAKGDIYNLTGGILAWDGAMTADYPRVQTFKELNDPVELFETAMNLEKGALNFYTFIQTRYTDQPWVSVFGTLAQAEIGHAKTVYHFLKRQDPGAADFDPLFDQLPGDVLEGGMSLQTAVDKVTAIQGRICMGLVEQALQIEYAAFDLYRTMADQSRSKDAQDAFITIAQAEKGHMRTLIKALSICTDES